MGIRRAARIIALQSLYQIEIAEKPMDEINEFIDNYSTANLGQEEKFIDKAKEFAKELVVTVEGKKAEIDGIIPKYLKNWKFDRILVIDRNILRIGVAELMFREDIPYKVTINEMIELAKRFGDEKSGSFVNGVLDNMVKTESANYPLLKTKMTGSAYKQVPHEQAQNNPQ
ncbi:MAG: transcription antitermination factor NusB [Spirochaetia bacterium]|nr:transcription antitermination factor NusB [Spirochaetia bacterium]